eukprot:8435132-Alexandrium_andersonii.AAC.1
MERRAATHSQEESAGLPRTGSAWLEAAGPWPLMSVGGLQALPPGSETAQPELAVEAGPSQAASA